MATRRQTAGRAVGRPAAKDRGRETETAILDAAEQHFARVGFYGARLQEIAGTAGITKAMIHYHFDSKDRLYRAVLDRILFELIKLVQETTGRRAGRVERLDTFVRGFFDYVARHPHFGRLTYMGSGEEGHYFDNIVSTFFRPLFERGVCFIEEGIAEGTFRRIDARQLLLSVYFAAMGYFADAHFVGLLLQGDALGETGIATRRAAVLDTIFAALGVRPPRRRNQTPGL